MIKTLLLIRLNRQVPTWSTYASQRVIDNKLLLNFGQWSGEVKLSKSKSSRLMFTSNQL